MIYKTKGDRYYALCRVQYRAGGMSQQTVRCYFESKEQAKAYLWKMHWGIPFDWNVTEDKT